MYMDMLGMRKLYLVILKYIVLHQHTNRKIPVGLTIVYFVVVVENEN